jgi:hypothetical protein
MQWLERVRAFVRRVAPAPERVNVDDEGVTREIGDGRHEHVAWAKLVEVTIVTTSEGPFAEDVWFVLHADDGTGCAVGHDQATRSGLVDRLLKLTGFEYEAFTRAMSETNDARFTVWKRDRL